MGYSEKPLLLYDEPNIVKTLKFKYESERKSRMAFDKLIVIRGIYLNGNRSTETWNLTQYNAEPDIIGLN